MAEEEKKPKTVLRRIKNTTHDQLLIMVESFYESISDEESPLFDNVESAVIIYRVKGGDIVFETMDCSTPEKVAILCAAVHTACIYEYQDPSIH